MTVPFRVRPLVKADAAVFVRLLEHFWAEALHEDPYLRPASDAGARVLNDFSYWLEDEGYALYGLEAEGELVGFIDAHRHTWPPLYMSAVEVFIRHLYVEPRFRQRGGASLLVDAVRRWAQDHQIERLRLNVLHANTTARAFWKRQGGEVWTSDVIIVLPSVPKEVPPSTRSIGFR